MGRHAGRHVDLTEETFSRRSSRHRAPFAWDDPNPATEPLTFLAPGKDPAQPTCVIPMPGYRWTGVGFKCVPIDEDHRVGWSDEQPMGPEDMPTSGCEF